MGSLHSLIDASSCNTLGAWFSGIVCVLSICAYILNKYPVELISVVGMGALIGFFSIFPVENAHHILRYSDLLRSLSNTALVSIVLMLIMCRAIMLSGVLNVVVRSFLDESRLKNGTILIIEALLFACIISTITNNTPIVVMFIPIMLMIANRTKIAGSKVMMRLSYATILGGMTTLIGNSTNILISEKLVELGYKRLEIFSFIFPGAVMCAMGMIYVLFVMPMILPDTEGDNAPHVDDKAVFDCFIKIEQSSALLDRNAEELFHDMSEAISIEGIWRDSESLIDSDTVLQEDDLLCLSASIDHIYSFIDKNSALVKRETGVVSRMNVANISLMQIIVLPGSKLIGKKIKNIDLIERSGIHILGVRRSKKTDISRARLKAGDVLLVLGDISTGMQGISEFALLECRDEKLPSKWNIIKVLCVFVITIGLSVSGTLALPVSLFCGVSVMCALQCIDARNLIKAVDPKVFFMISFSYMLSSALYETGAIDSFLDFIFMHISIHDPKIAMSALFAMIMICNEFVSNNAIGLIFAPVGLKLADKMHADPRMFIYAVIFASSCAFMTPIGYQTNLLVTSHGKYKFSDFTKYGAPLSILMWFTYSMFSYFYF